jgi:hypothetical protein
MVWDGEVGTAKEASLRPEQAGISKSVAYTTTPYQQGGRASAGYIRAEGPMTLYGQTLTAGSPIVVRHIA